MDDVLARLSGRVLEQVRVCDPGPVLKDNVLVALCDAMDAAMLPGVDRRRITRAIQRALAKRQAPAVPREQGLMEMVREAHQHWHAELKRQRALEMEAAQCREALGEKLAKRKELLERLADTEFDKANRRRMRMLADVMFCIDDINRDNVSACTRFGETG